MNRRWHLPRTNRARTQLTALCMLAGAAGIAFSRTAPDRGADTATSGCFQYSVRTDHNSYSRGAPVNLLVTATNVSTRTCRGRSCGGVTPSFEVFNAAGKSVYIGGGAGIACVANPPPPAMIRPGQAEVWSDGPWDQLGSWSGPCKPGNCRLTRTQAPPGPYRITWRWLDTLSVSTAWFWLST